MGFLGFQHDYIEGALLKSSDWDDELNRIVALLGSAIIATPNAEVLLKDFTTGVNNPVLKLENLLTGNILEFINNNATASSFIRNNGQLDLGANGVVGLIIASNLKCPNLNADLLNSLHSTDLETKIYSMHSFQVFWDANDLLNGEQEIFIPTTNGSIITKLKAQQQGVASADATTTIEVRKNGVSIGTITINGNSNAVVTNDIGDVTIGSTGGNPDVISFHLTAYAGGTKHTAITSGFHYKNKYGT